MPEQSRTASPACNKDVGRTCPGHCCVAFYLAIPHHRIDEAADRLMDGEVIADMVIPLSVAEANERLEWFGTDREYVPQWEGHVYTCRHFDDRTRLCAIYEERPQMCRDYPHSNEGGCEFECGYRGARSARQEVSPVDAERSRDVG